MEYSSLYGIECLAPSEINEKTYQEFRYGVFRYRSLNNIPQYLDILFNMPFNIFVRKNIVID